MEGPQPATERPLGPTVLTFHTPRTEKIKGDRSYQRPVLPTQKHWIASLSPWQQQHLLKQTHLYIRSFCTGLCGFTLVLLLCISPMPWVQFLLAKNGLELHAGLWTLCEHHLCWSHIPSPPYYLQISRFFFLLSAFTAFIILAWVINSCRHRKEPSTHLDRGVAILSLTSGVSLFICLVLFLMQVKKHTRYNMGSSYLWIFHFNWWGGFFYVVAGLISFFNYKTFRILPRDLDFTEILLTRRRLGINPKMWLSPATEEEEAESGMAVDPVVEIEATVASLGKKVGHKVNNNK
ncbi:transmembrane protein 202-like [Trichosurus vulpecula]|uniref:transmembrane protein 202-like n=1 Tax=Trichosurus vulpecula TaxID=9337 RepID=UPI00186B15A8|nr:transmembrane protein 202-like [Trichosurus vulpecula]